MVLLLRMATFSNEEMADMHLMYGRSYGNSLGARRMYHEAFPYRRLPNERTFDNIDRRLRETGVNLKCNTHFYLEIISIVC